MTSSQLWVPIPDHGLTKGPIPWLVASKKNPSLRSYVSYSPMLQRWGRPKTSGDIDRKADICICHIPRCSMVLEYLPTFTPKMAQLCRCQYSSNMGHASGMYLHLPIFQHSDIPKNWCKAFLIGLGLQGGAPPVMFVSF